MENFSVGDGVSSASLAEYACAAIMRALVGNAPAADDVAVLVLHRQPAAGQWRCLYAAA